MVPPLEPTTMDNVLQILTTSNNLQALAHTLRGMPKETRDQIWASPLGSGQDPLDVLDTRGNTLGVLYILSARLALSGAPPPRWEVVEEFCAHFDAEQARAAPERVLQLARGIQKYTNEAGSPHHAIPLILSLLRHFSPSPTVLTPLHPLLLLIALATRQIAPVLPLLSPNPITDLSPYNDLAPQDVLTYFYTAGIILGCVERWEEAEEMMEYVLVHPGYPCAIQLEAVKKHRLFGLIVRGKPAPLPKQTHPLLSRLFKSTPYQLILISYPNHAALTQILTEHQQLFIQEKNLGLVKRAVDMGRVWSVKKLTGTYVTLSLEEIGREVGVEDVEEVRGVVISMIERGTLHATLPTPNTVSFSDPPPSFTKADVDRVLRDVQRQAEMLKGLDGEMGRGKEYLAKIVKSQQSDSWGTGGTGGIPASVEEDLFASLSAAGIGGGGTMWEEV